MAPVLGRLFGDSIVHTKTGKALLHFLNRVAHLVRLVLPSVGLAVKNGGVN